MKLRSHRRRPILVAGALAVVVGLPFAHGSPARAATHPADVPYSLPVQLPTTTASPAVDATAPYTPVVLSLIAQLEAQGHGLANADSLLFGGPNPTCNNVGPTSAPLGTTPSIMAQCWTDAQGVNPRSTDELAVR